MTKIITFEQAQDFAARKRRRKAQEILELVLKIPHRERADALRNAIRRAEKEKKLSKPSVSPIR